MKKLQKYIEKKTKQNLKILDLETKDSKNDLIQFIKDNNIILFGKSALELYLDMELTLPIYSIFNKSIKIYKDFFIKLNRKYKYAFKLQPLLHKKTYYFDFRLTKYLYMYLIDMDKFKKEKNGFYYVIPIISVIDIYNMYSTPLYNTNFYNVLCKVEQKFIKSLKLKDSLIFNEDEPICDTKICENEIYKSFYKIIFNRYILDNEHILLTGSIAINDILETNILDSIDIIISKNRIEDEFKKLSELIKGIEKKEIKNNYHYFNNIYGIYLDGVLLLTYYESDVPFCYYKKYKRSNYHTIIFIYLLKYLMYGNNNYLDYIYHLMCRVKDKNILGNNKYQCFQSTFVKDFMSDVLLIKNKII